MSEHLRKHLSVDYFLESWPPMTELPRYEMELSDNERDIRAIPKGASRRSCVFVDADAEHWIKASDHDAYVADVSLRLQQLEQEKATLRKDLSKLACSYCDNVMEFESPEARWTEAGRARQIDHILECPNRPELKLIEKLEASEAALAETREALQTLLSFDGLSAATRADWASLRTFRYRCRHCGAEVQACGEVKRCACGAVSVSGTVYCETLGGWPRDYEMIGR